MPTTKWTPRSETPVRTDEERNKLFSEHCNSKRDLARHFALNFFNKWKFARMRYSLEDWEQVARMGLLKAASCWDESNGAKFVTYAGMCINRELHKVLNRGGIIATPENHRDLPTCLKYAEVVARVKQITDIELGKLQNNREGTAFHDEYHEIVDLMKYLPAREKVAITERYLNGKILGEVGDVLGVSKERARQLIMKGIARIQKMLKKQNSSMEVRQ